MTIRTTYRNLPVKQKLRLIVMVTVTAALLFACAVVLGYDRLATRESMRNDLEESVEMLGGNSTAALSFNDAGVGTEILSTLRAKRPIVAAFLSPQGDCPWRAITGLENAQRLCPRYTRTAFGLMVKGWWRSKASCSVGPRLAGSTSNRTWGSLTRGYGE